MIKVICNFCKNEVPVVPYFYDHKITTEINPMSQEEYYKAKVNAQAICPICGTMIYQTYTATLDFRDIEQRVLEKNNQC